MASPLEVGAGLLQSASGQQQKLTESVLSDITSRRNANLSAATNIGTTALSQYGAGKRQQESEKAATERQVLGDKAAAERQQQQIETQFITLTPQLKKGAGEVSGDKSWSEIPDGTKMRADVYSALIASGVQMNKQNQPQTFEIQEGDQVYTAEYDPKTRKLRKLTSGGNKFSPDARDGSRGTSQLNPFTLQNVIRQDEKTLLELLKGKGRKGIPKEGLIPGFSDKEKATLGTLRSITTRLKNNYANLQKLEVDRGLQPTEMDPTVLDAINALAEADQNKAPANKVLMKTKGGTEVYIPADKVEEAIKRGATRVQR